MVHQFSVSLPKWAVEAVESLPSSMNSVEDRMRQVIRFARRNVEEDTGGPFAAGVFEENSGRLVAMGVNRVIPENCSSAHAEMVALSLAQATLGTFDLGAANLPAHQLVVNWRPCAMCYGAVIWSGVRALAIAGSDGQLEDITGFDEGPIHPNWRAELADRGISLVDNVMKEETCDVFRMFRDQGRAVYNGRGG